jgi:periplasmic divalent cation tolerance protein
LQASSFHASRLSFAGSEGKDIAHHLVKEKLAACCNIIPGSVYEWQGKVEEDPELLLMIKSTQNKISALTAAVQKLHTYDECEVIAVPVIGGSSSYIQWVESSVRSD